MWVSTRSGAMMSGGMPVAIFTVPTEALGPGLSVTLVCQCPRYVRGFLVSQPTLSLGALEEVVGRRSPRLAVKAGQT
jgi:hypothetical protein